MDPPLAVLDKPNKMTMKFKCYALKKKKQKNTRNLNQDYPSKTFCPILKS